MNDDPTHPVITAWALYNLLLELANELRETYQLEFLERCNPAVAPPAEPAAAEATTELDINDLPF